MKRRPLVPSPATAAEMLNLVDYATVAAPENPLTYLRGYLTARSLAAVSEPPERLPEPDFLGGAS